MSSCMQWEKFDFNVAEQLTWGLFSCPRSMAKGL
jgi:hypothetical protein